jgi:hypothetical protein
MAEKVYIQDEFLAAARALQIPINANPDQINTAYKQRLKECANDPRREEELLHAKNILTGSSPTMEELVRYTHWKKKQLKGPAHSERPPTFWDRARSAIGSAAAPRKLLSFAAPFLDGLQSNKNQLRDPSEISASNRTIPERVQTNLENGSPTRSIWSYLNPGSRGENRPSNSKGPRR